MDKARLLQEEESLRSDSDWDIVPSTDDPRGKRRRLSLKLSLLFNGVLLVACALFYMQTQSFREKPFVQSLYCKPFKRIVV